MPKKRQLRAVTATGRRRANDRPRVALVDLQPADQLDAVQGQANLNQDFCLILADFGADGKAFLGTDEGDATFERAVRDIVEREVENVVAVLQFNPAVGHARDVTQDVARAVSERVLHDGEYPHESLRRFLDAYGLAYPPSLEAQVFQRWLEPARGARKGSSPSGRTSRAQKLPKKRPAGSAKSKRGKAARGGKPKGRMAGQSSSKAPK